MKKRVIVAAFLAWILGSSSQAQIQFGVSGGDGSTHFYLSIGNYFNVPQNQVTVIREKQIPDDQITVVLFIAQRAHVAPQAVIDLRLGGSSWMDIALHFGLGPDAFYVPLQTNPGPPYGNAYGYYRHHKRKDWKRIHLEDDDIVNLVNLRFLSESNHCTPDEIIKMRAQGRNFVDINENWHAKTAHRRNQRKDENKGEDQNEGHGHGHGKGHGHGHHDGDNNGHDHDDRDQD